MEVGEESHYCAIMVVVMEESAIMPTHRERIESLEECVEPLEIARHRVKLLWNVSVKFSLQILTLQNSSRKVNSTPSRRQSNLVSSNARPGELHLWWGGIRKWNTGVNGKK